ncbi:MAG: hypothetical protein AB7U73_15610 [Pirellulales bacterium]
MSTMLSGFCYCLIGFVGADAMAPGDDRAAKPVLEMQDQFAKPRKLSDLRGDVVVLVFSDRGGAEASRALGAKLHVEFHPQAQGLPPAQAAQAPVRPLPNWPAAEPQPEARLVAVAVIGEVPSALRPMVRFRFRQVAPEGAIWLDMHDTMRKQFRVVPDVPNVAVLDKQGQVRYTTSGSLDAAGYQQLVAAIDALRGERRAEQVARSPQPGGSRPPTAR